MAFRVSVLGIDTDRRCRPHANVDLVHFVWEEFMRFTYKQYALTLTPQGARSLLPGLTFVENYRVESDGWKDRGTVTTVASATWTFSSRFMHATLVPPAPARPVQGKLRPWPIVPVTSSFVHFEFTLTSSQVRHDI